MTLICVGPVQAGDHAWSQDTVSPAINHKNVAIVARHIPGSSATLTSTSRITRVQASRSYQGNAQITTRLCWNGTDRCVSLTGASVSTHEFDGLDASKPLYLVHTVVAAHPGPLPSPVFVKGSVVVWYRP
ncbi:hypothetical protein CR155_12500 [Pollutimonas nitritireducens]|uniref:Flagellar protein FlhE n=1 Tax=Pollutimonas nitritireducens TaxID=2045209 RepID=A0A2N4UF36_9BURK|nr:flagellar protein FlhE [Pollutimonas nitritireducens]PLC53629.1 hypothetical protein CR155_12500 [Pollutimonas nitritireducens]